MGLALSNKLPKIVVDTSALLSLCDGYDFFSNVEKEFGKVRYVIPTSVLSELKKLAKDSNKYTKCYNLILRIITVNNIKVVYPGNDKGYADDDLLETSGDLFVTNDMALAKKLKNQNKKVFILKNKRYYDYY